MQVIRSAKINGGTETAKYRDMVEFNGPDGRLITGAVTSITRAHGVVYIQLDSKWQVESWYVRKAKPAATIRPGVPLTLGQDLEYEQIRLAAGTVIRPLYWRAGVVTVELADTALVRLPHLTITVAAYPNVDWRLVRWER